MITNICNDLNISFTNFNDISIDSLPFLVFIKQCNKKLNMIGLKNGLIGNSKKHKITRQQKIVCKLILLKT